jgi:hypothetical protein
VSGGHQRAVCAHSFAGLAASPLCQLFPGRTLDVLQRPHVPPVNALHRGLCQAVRIVAALLAASTGRAVPMVPVVVVIHKFPEDQ